MDRTIVGRVRLAVYLLFVVMATGTVPTPLFPAYAARHDYSPLTLTLIFAIYALGILVTLLSLGRVSDVIGRPPVLAAGVAVAALSMALLAVQPPLIGILVARVLTGIGVGLTTGAVTAHVGELLGDRNRAALISGVTNMAGLGFGGLLGGVAGELAQNPLRTPYLVALVLMVPALLLSAREDLRPRRPPATAASSTDASPLVRPATERRSLAGAGLGVFAAFSVLGLVASLTGSFLAVEMAISNSALTGALVFLSFGAAAVAQWGSNRLAPRRGLGAGIAVLPCGAVVLIAGLGLAVLPLFVVGILISGTGAGIVFRCGLTTVSLAAAPERVAFVVSRYFACAYLGLTVPVVGVGLLSSPLTLPGAGWVFAGVVVGCAAAAAAVLTTTLDSRLLRRGGAQKTPCTPDEDRSARATHST